MRKILLLLVLLVSGLLHAQCIPGVIPFREGTHWGLCDSSRNVILPCVYDVINAWSDSSMFILVKDGKYGVADAQGKPMVPIEYDYAGFSDNGIMVNRDGLFGFLDRQGRTLIPVVYTAIYRETEELMIVEKDSRSGLYSISRQQEVVPCLYKEVLTISASVYVVATIGGKEGAYNRAGKLIVPVMYEDVSLVEQDSALVHAWSSNSSITCDTLGNVICKTPYEFMARNDSLLLLEKKDKLLILDKNGKVRAPGKGEALEPNAYGKVDYAYIVFNASKQTFGVTTSWGKVIAPCVYAAVWPCTSRSGQLLYFLSDKSHPLLIDSTGTTLVDFGKIPTERIIVYTDRIIYAVDSNYGCIDFYNRQLVPFRYPELKYEAQSHQYLFSQNGRTGVLDSTGEILAEARYTMIRPFIGNLALVNDDSGTKRVTNNLIDKSGNFLFVPGTYDTISLLFTYDPNPRGIKTVGYATVNYTHGHGAIDIAGKRIIPDTFDRVDAFPYGFRAWKKSRCMFFDTTGKAVSGLVCLKSGDTDQRTRLTAAYVGNKMGFVNEEGRQIVPSVYESQLLQMYSGNYDMFGPREPVYNSSREQIFMVQPVTQLIDVYTTSGKKIAGVSGKAKYLCSYNNQMNYFIFGDLGSFYGRDQRLYGLMDSTGKIILPKKYLVIARDGADSSKIFTLDSLKQAHWFSPEGIDVGPPVYDRAGLHQEIKGVGFIRSKKNKYGVVSAQGKEVIPFVYDALLLLDSGVLIYDLGDKFGLMDVRGNKITEPLFSSVQFVRPGLYYVNRQDFIDRHGRQYWKE